MTIGVPHGMTSVWPKCTNGGGAVKATPASDPDHQLSDGDFPQAYRADDDDRYDDADAPDFAAVDGWEAFWMTVLNGYEYELDLDLFGKVGS